MSKIIKKVNKKSAEKNLALEFQNSVKAHNTETLTVSYRIGIEATRIEMKEEGSVKPTRENLQVRYKQRGRAGTLKSRITRGRYGRLLSMEEQRKKESRRLSALEGKIPHYAKVAVKKAVADSIDQGLPITIGEDGVIKEVFPDGTVRILKEAPQQLELEVGSIFELK